MKNIKEIFELINEGNREAIESFIKSSRTYVTDTARSLVNDDKLAIKIAEETYEKIIFDSSIINNSDDYISIINKTIREVADKYVDQDIEIKEIEVVNNDIALDNINTDKYKDYFNDVKVEKVIYDTINSLPKEEKQIIIRSYFGGETVEQLALDYGVSEQSINSYIARANKLIDDKSKALFVKYKIATADYSKVEIVYSTIKNIVSIMKLDVVGIAVDKAKDSLKDDDNEEKDLKKFVKDILEDLVGDWFLDKLKSLVVMSTAGAVAEEATRGTAKIAAKKVIGSAVAKKVVIGVVAASVATTGGVAVYNAINTKQEVKENSRNSTTATAVYGTYPLSIDYYSDEDSNEVEELAVEIVIPVSEINEIELKTIEVSAKLLGGLSISHKENGINYIINVVVNKEKVSTKIIDFAGSIGILDSSTIDMINNLLSMNNEELSQYLSDLGFTCSQN